MINIFDNDDKTSSSLPVVISILDGIHHYIFHVQECGLRDPKQEDGDIGDNKTVGGDEYHDVEFAAMNKRILSTRKNTKRFSRFAAGKKFSINITSNDERKMNMVIQKKNKKKV